MKIYYSLFIFCFVLFAVYISKIKSENNDIKKHTSPIIKMGTSAGH